MHTFSTGPDDMTFEEQFNVAGRRIFPWKEAVAEPFWGGAWIDVAPGATSTAHSHDENEIFFFTEGSGIIRIGDEKRRVSAGEAVFITNYEDHDVTNDTDSRLRFIAIWWGSAEAIAAERAYWAAQFGIEDPGATPSALSAAEGVTGR
ncbi:cupin domain-containing protein [Streptomyces sp. NPDC054975]